MDMDDEDMEMMDEDEGNMTVREAGHKGGEMGGKEGGQRVKELIEEGKEHERER